MGEKVLAAVRALDITTPLGKVQFDDKGDLRSALIYIFQVKDGQFAPVTP